MEVRNTVAEAINCTTICGPQVVPLRRVCIERERSKLPKGPCVPGGSIVLSQSRSGREKRGERSAGAGSQPGGEELRKEQLATATSRGDPSRPGCADAPRLPRKSAAALAAPRARFRLILRRCDPVFPRSRWDSLRFIGECR